MEVRRVWHLLLKLIDSTIHRLFKIVADSFAVVRLSINWHLVLAVFAISDLIIDDERLYVRVSVIENELSLGVFVLVSVVSKVTSGQSSSWHQLCCLSASFLFIYIYNLVEGYRCWRMCWPSSNDFTTGHFWLFVCFGFSFKLNGTQLKFKMCLLKKILS